MSAIHTEESFWSLVGIRGPDDCWPWLSGVNRSGYGTVTWNGAPYLAHRVAAWLCKMVVSPAAPKDKTAYGIVLHKCDYPACCNPAHFEIGTTSKNQSDAYARGLRAPLRGGVDHPIAKLTADQVREIRQAYALKEKSQKELAAQYGVDQVTISHAVRRVTYKWIL